MSFKYIRLASDLHLEQYMGQSMRTMQIHHLPKDERDAESVLVLAGDISSSPTQLVEFIQHVESRFAKVLYVPGNHEFYRHEMSNWIINTGAEMKLHLVNTEPSLDGMRTLVFGDTRFIFGTYWADGGRTMMERGRVGNGLWDFRIITYHGQVFTVEHMRNIHRASRKFLEEELAIPFAGKTVVISHHLPSYRLCHPRFGDEINGGFASDSDRILAADNAPDMWFHGHTHDTIDTKLWKCRILCNPSGYRPETRGSVFNSYEPKFIELG